MSLSLFFLVYQLIPFYILNPSFSVLSFCNLKSFLCDISCWLMQSKSFFFFFFPENLIYLFLPVSVLVNNTTVELVITNNLGLPLPRDLHIWLSYHSFKKLSRVNQVVLRSLCVLAVWDKSEMIQVQAACNHVLGVFLLLWHLSLSCSTGNILPPSVFWLFLTAQNHR